MTTHALRTVSAALATALLLGLFPDVGFAAGPLLTGTGTGELNRIDVRPIREAGPNRIEERVLEGVVQGVFEGTIVETVTGVIHPNGLVTFHGTLDFEGTVEGCGAGTLQAALSGRGQTGLPVTDATFRVINQASNTLAVTGTGSVHQKGLHFTYEVQYRCR